MCKLGIWQPGICRDSFKAGSSNEADRTPELRAFRVRLFSPCRIPGTLHQRREKKLRTAQLRHQDKDPGTLPFGGAIKGDLHESSELPWHSAFRIWQRIKGLSRLSRTWTMALCLSVAPSKAIFMSRLNSTRTWNAPACSDLAKDAQKGTHQSTGALARSSLCWSWRGYPEECCVFLDRAH